jgi:hypothetical protein
MVMGHARRLLVLSAIFLGLVFNGCDGGDGSNGGDHRDPEVISGRATEVPDVVEEFRTRLGRDNGGVPERGFTGRREINWDSVPDEDAAPGFLSPDFFNTRTEPLARGIRFTTPGDGVMVSADSSNPTNTPVRFGQINPTYPNQFQTFSAERLFSPIGSNIVDITFFIPGAPDEPALTRGFGAIYTDVDETHSSFEFFGEDDVSLGTFFVPTNPEGLSFLGVLFDNSVVKRIRITYGNSPLGPTDGGDVDVAVMDDFIFAEPQPQD